MRNDSGFGPEFMWPGGCRPKALPMAARIGLTKRRNPLPPTTKSLLYRAVRSTHLICRTR